MAARKPTRRTKATKRAPRAAPPPLPAADRPRTSHFARFGAEYPAVAAAYEALSAATQAAGPLDPKTRALVKLALAVGGWLLARGPVGPEGHDGAQLGAMWAAAYEHALANRDAPDGKPFCCDPTVDFCGTCEKRFDVRLGFGAIGKNITLRGCYCGLSTGGCIAALVDTTAGPVGVCVVPRGKDPRPQLPPQSPWRLVRRDLGALTLYAVGGAAADPAVPLAQFRIEP
ncbi:MAG: hypothetical protein ACK595_20005 [Planctomycetota bacterium]